MSVFLNRQNALESVGMTAEEAASDFKKKPTIYI
jgi:hypothetical protein